MPRATKFPEPPPPGGLAAHLPSETLILSAGELFWRVYDSGSPFPMAWNEFRTGGPITSRFDHRLSAGATPTRKILYAARDVYTTLAERFQTGRTIDRSMNQPWLVGFRLTRDVSVLDLTGAWPTRAGASMVIASGQHARARRWSQRIYEDYPTIEGLYYPSSMYGNRPSVALYERGETAMPAAPSFNRALADPLLDGVVATASYLLRYDVRS